MPVRCLCVQYASRIIHPLARILDANYGTFQV
jgi:hypothetical protein